MFNPDYPVLLETQLLNYDATDYVYGGTFRRLALSLLQDYGHHPLKRSFMTPGHFTGSAWVINPARTKVIMLHHGLLGRWFQPGGHADENPDLAHVARKEGGEELGIDLNALIPLSNDLFDLDIHRIPECKDRSGQLIPEHVHLDLAYLFELDESVPIPGNEESREVRWLTFDEATAHATEGGSLWRRVAKTRKLSV